MIGSRASSKRSRSHEGCTPPSSFRTKREAYVAPPSAEGSVPCATHTPSLPLERQYPSCDTPSYDPGFRVSRAAPGGERPRLTQTQNRSPFVALLATSPPRNPLSLPPLSPSPKEARHTRDDIPALSWGREREKER